MRFRAEPRDVPAHVMARRMGLSEAQFRECLPALLARGIPPADPTTGHFDLKAADDWMDRRHGLTTALAARDASAVVADRLKALGGG